MSKDEGNAAFKAKDFNKAIECYTKALEETPTDHTIYGNRSASYHNLKKFREAVNDAEKCIELKSDWSKGYQRKGMALHGLRYFEDSVKAFEEGLKLDPENA